MKKLFRPRHDLAFLAGLLLLALATWTVAYAGSGNSGPRGGPGKVHLGPCISIHEQLLLKANDAVTPSQFSQLNQEIQYACSISEEAADCLIQGVRHDTSWKILDKECLDHELGGNNA